MPDVRAFKPGDYKADKPPFAKGTLVKSLHRAQNAKLILVCDGKYHSDTGQFGASVVYDALEEHWHEEYSDAWNLEAFEEV